MPEDTSWLSPGFQAQFLVDAGAQIQARGAGAGVVRQHAADPLVEDLHFQLSHFFGASMPATCSRSLRASSSFGPAAERVLAARVVERDGAVVAAERLLRQVADDQRQLLLRAASPSRSAPGSRSRRRSRRRTAASAAPATQARMSGFSSSSSDRCAVRLLDLLRGRILDPVVGDRGDGDEDVGALHVLLHRLEHLLRGAHVDARHARPGWAATPAR